MGAKKLTKGHFYKETPRHRGEITNNLYVGTYPMTQQLWDRVMGFNPSTHIGQNRPVEHIITCHVELLCDGLINHGYQLAHSSNQS